LKTIVLLTASYPFSLKGEYMFIEQELAYLSKNFNIIILPLKKEVSKRKDFISDFKNVLVLEDAFSLIKTKYEIFKIWKYKKYFFSELKYIKDFKSLVKLFYYFFNTLNIERSIAKLIENKILPQNAIYYTFWFNYGTSALVNIKKSKKIDKLITRVHGGDLYFERNQNYIPFRENDIKYIDKIIATSNESFRYLQYKYKLKNSKIELFYLLSKDFKIINLYNKEKKLKLIGCSFLSSIKRVDKVIELLSIFSKKNKIEVEYTHIGDGVDFEKINKLAIQYRSDLYKINLLGFKNIDEIMDIYKNNSFDYFITLSETEGGVPFSLREASSCEIPLIGTKVGGIVEIIIDNYNGFLVNRNLNEKEILNIFKKAYYKKFEISYLKMRENSRKLFLKKFEVTNNCNKFINFLNRL